MDLSDKEVQLTLRLIHIMSAALLVGGVFFNHYLLRPALTRIPPPQQAIVSTAIGNFFVYLAWITLALLLTTGLLRLEALGGLGRLGDASFWDGGYGRWLAVMIGGWLVATTDAIIMTLIIRPVLLKRLPLIPQPAAADMQTRRESAMRAGKWVERVVLVNVISTLVALIAGASLFWGGIVIDVRSIIGLILLIAGAFLFWGGIVGNAAKVIALILLIAGGSLFGSGIW